MPLTNLDQHDGTTGPSLKPAWSFSASPATFTKKKFFLLREEILGGGKAGWRVALLPLENGDRERWPPRPGYSQLGGVGHVEPDK